MIDPILSGQMNFEPMIAKKGDIFLLDAFVPHGTGDNRSDKPRRNFVLSFNRLDDGNFNKGCSIFVIPHMI